MTGDLSSYLAFEQRPFGSAAPSDIDLLVLSAFAYARLEACEALSAPGASVPLRDLPQLGPLEELAERDYNPAGMLRLLNALVESPRFADLPIERFTSIEDPAVPVQFAALCLPLSDGLVAIVFRGTNATSAGWRETFDMAHLTATPGQELALRYLYEAAAAYPEARLLVCGHSKGGANAEYAALFADDGLGARIERVLSFDGPSLFRAAGDACLDLAGYDIALAERMQEVQLPFKRYVFPSMTGLLMENRDPAAFSYIASVDSDLEHNACAAMVVDGKLVPVEPDLDGMPLRNARAINGFAELLTLDERRFFSDWVVDVGDAVGLFDPGTDTGPVQLVRAAFSNYAGGDREHQAIVRRLLAKYVRARLRVG